MISVIVAAYNAERYLQACVDSLWAQSYPKWEAIIIDDGSQDGTLALAHRLAEQDPRLAVIHQANGGRAAARNVGLAHLSSHSQYILFFDSDDELEPEALAVLLSALEEHPDAAGVCGTCGLIDVEGRPTTWERPTISWSNRRAIINGKLVPVAAEAPITYEQLTFQNHLVPGATLLRRSAVENTGLFDTTCYMEDYELFWRMTVNGGMFVPIETQVLRYRQHGAMSSGNRKLMRASMHQFRRSRICFPGLTAEQRRVARLACYFDSTDKLHASIDYLRQGKILKSLREAARSIAAILRLGINVLSTTHVNRSQAVP